MHIILFTNEKYVRLFIHQFLCVGFCLGFFFCVGFLVLFKYLFFFTLIFRETCCFRFG